MVQAGVFLLALRQVIIKGGGGAMGIDVHEKRRLNGDPDRNPSSSAYGGDGASTTLYKGYYRHHWSYYKARAVRRREKKETT